MIVFDVDGTLLPGTSCERLFFHHLIDRRVLTFLNLFHFAFRGMTLLPHGRTYALKANKGYLSGHSLERMTAIGKEFFHNEVAGRISKKGIARLNEHRDKGEKVILLSGMPEFLLINFAEYLKIENYRGSVIEINKGKITGKTVGIFPLSKGKVDIVESIIKESNIVWGDVTAYADHYGDRYLLGRVGRPIAVNPDYGLRQVAVEKGWAIEVFD